MDNVCQFRGLGGPFPKYIDSRKALDVSLKVLSHYNELVHNVLKMSGIIINTLEIVINTSNSLLDEHITICKPVVIMCTDRKITTKSIVLVEGTFRRS